MTKPCYQAVKKRKRMALRTPWLQERPWKMLRLLISLAKSCQVWAAGAHYLAMSLSTSALLTNQS